MENVLRIEKCLTDKREFLPLLLVGDESERMIDRYLDRCDLYVGFLNDEAIALCAVECLDSATVEVRNLAVADGYRRCGYGRGMLEFAERMYRGKSIILGTGETPSTLRFYMNCGYSYSHRIDNFFIDNYPDPIVEEGVMLRDMIYLKKETVE